MSANILVVALNPSIDVEWRVTAVRWEEKNSIISERRWAGGKGVNVARWLKHLGARPTLLLPAGGNAGKELMNGLKGQQLTTTMVGLQEQTRANVIVTTDSGRQLRFNPLGPLVSSSEWKKILEAVGTQGRRGGIAIFSGSLPRGVPATAYRQLIGIAKNAGMTCILDSDGPAFAAGVEGEPFLVKPNEEELSQWRGRPLQTTTQVIDAASALSSTTRHWVMVSRGRRGALLVNSRLNMVCQAAAPNIEILNTVGAGDAMLAGAAKAISENQPPEQWLRCGVSCGSRAASRPAGILPPHQTMRQLSRQMKLRQRPV